MLVSFSVNLPSLQHRKCDETVTKLRWDSPIFLVPYAAIMVARAKALYEFRIIFRKFFVQSTIVILLSVFASESTLKSPVANMYIQQPHLELCWARIIFKLFCTIINWIDPL